ncbi:hypothetical protein HDU67_007957 [Dinochytrium kinnereticum]|nr:hypothetical protein HDU67_007957 [Dinochytrium kinnereticum]
MAAICDGKSRDCAAKDAEIAAATDKASKKVLKTEKANIASKAKADIDNLNQAERAHMAAISVEAQLIMTGHQQIPIPQTALQLSVAAGTPELQYRRMKVTDDRPGGGTDHVTDASLLTSARGQSEADYRDIQARIQSGTLPINLPPGATLESIAALEPNVKGGGRLTGGRTQGNVNAVINVDGQSLGVIIHCDLARRSIEALEANTNVRLTARLERRAAAGSAACKKAHANKIAGNMKELFKNKAANKDGSFNVKDSLANLKKSNPSIVGKISKSSLGPKGKAKKWPKVETPPADATPKSPKGSKRANPSKGKSSSKKGSSKTGRMTPKAKSAGKKATRASGKAAGKRGAGMKASPGKKGAGKRAGKIGAGKRSAGKKTSGKRAAKGARKAAAKRAAGKKSPGRKATGKKSPGRKAAGKKSPGRKPAGKKKAAGKKSPARKAAGKKSPARKAAARKAPAKKAPARKAAGKKAPAKKAPARKAPAKKAPARKAPAKKAPARKAPAKKAPARKAPAKKGKK